MSDWRIKNLPKNLKGDRNPRWKGGIHNRKDGYILVRKGTFKKGECGAKYTLQHRLIMEDFLKRKLLRSEIVHHKNGIRNDNRIDNLVIMTQSEHAKQDYILRNKNHKGQLQPFKDQ